MNEPGIELPSFAGSLALSFVSLGVVCLLAYVGLRWLSRRGVGGSGGAIRVVARCPLEPRRALVVVRVAERCFLLGVGEGPTSMLAELDPSAFREEDRQGAGSGSTFSDLLRGTVLGRKIDSRTKGASQCGSNEGEVR
ncbi:MAG: flagellar biosynthetic protein FliO [Deltaproteobacteria bacterium]|nr:flagellar biosynthetic protein FliO [Deltaproteobacteria bacterium]